MNIAKKKLKIIKIVEELHNDKYINWLLKVLEVLKILPSDASFTPPPVTDKESNEEDYLANLMEIAKQPTPDHIPLEQLIKEQNYDPRNLAKTLENWDYKLFEDELPAEELIKLI